MKTICKYVQIRQQRRVFWSNNMFTMYFYTVYISVD